MSEKYTNQNIIKSIGYNQSDMIKDIIKLYCPNGIELDPTYSKGNFYKEIEKPKYCFDIEPKYDYVKQASCENLPFKNESIQSIMFDPPFVITSKNIKNNVYKDGSNIIHNRFSSFYPASALFEFYDNSLKEFYRILKQNGILIFKCQDTVSGGKQYLSHVNIINSAVALGFYPKDMFVLLAKTRILSYKGGVQKHARKYHSYFLVFEKK